MSHTLALSNNGEVYAWGQAFYGALGIKNVSDTIYSPQKIESLFSEQVIDISAGSRHSLFLNSKCQVFGCGDQN